MAVFDAIWGGLTTVGTSLALVLIIVLALSIAALAIFYLGSAVVVLERFARRARRWDGLVAAWAMAALAYAAIAAQPGGVDLAGPGFDLPGPLWLPLRLMWCSLSLRSPCNAVQRAT